MVPYLFFSHEEEDLTVLVSPEKPLRRGLSHRSNPNAAVAPTLQGVRFSLGPLSPEKLEEILDEANRLAAQLEECALQDRESAGAGPGKPSPRAKPSPRRETFVLKDSPVRDLLPTVSSWSTPSPSSLTGLRSSDKKGSARAVRVTSGKKPPSTKKVSMEGRIACVPQDKVPETLSELKAGVEVFPSLFRGRKVFYPWNCWD
ncbi:proline/serine-rich coiled-coil 1 [Cricetulus griseus]